MKKLSYEIKTLIIMTIITLILCILSSYFSWQIGQLNDDILIIQDDLVTTHDKLTKTREKLQDEIDKTRILNEELNNANKTIADLQDEEYKFVYIGDFKLTHYCSEPYEHICGEGHDLTATGTKVTPGRTIAVDPAVIPYGTEVYIEGYGWRTAEDCGGAVNGSHIDIAVDNHSDALALGTKTGGVWLLVK